MQPQMQCLARHHISYNWSGG